MSIDICSYCDQRVDTDFDLDFYDTDPPACSSCKEPWEKAEYLNELNRRYTQDRS